VNEGEELYAVSRDIMNTKLTGEYKEITINIQGIKTIETV